MYKLCKNNSSLRTVKDYNLWKDYSNHYDMLAMIVYIKKLWHITLHSYEPRDLLSYLVMKGFSIA